MAALIESGGSQLILVLNSFYGGGKDDLYLTLGHRSLESGKPDK